MWLWTNSTFSHITSQHQLSYQLSFPRNEQCDQFAIETCLQGIERAITFKKPQQRIKQCVAAHKCIRYLSNVRCQQFARNVRISAHRVLAQKSFNNVNRLGHLYSTLQCVQYSSLQHSGWHVLTRDHEVSPATHVYRQVEWSSCLYSPATQPRLLGIELTTIESRVQCPNYWTTEPLYIYSMRLHSQLLIMTLTNTITTFYTPTSTSVVAMLMPVAKE